MKKPAIWALVAKQDTVEYKKGEVIEVSLWRRNLMISKPNYAKVIKLYN